MWWSQAPMVKMSPMHGGRIPQTPRRISSPFSEWYQALVCAMDLHLGLASDASAAAGHL